MKTRVQVFRAKGQFYVITGHKTDREGRPIVETIGNGANFREGLQNYKIAQKMYADRGYDFICLTKHSIYRKKLADGTEYK